MSKTEMIRARVNPELRDKVLVILEELNISESTAIRMFYAAVVNARGIPFELKLPK